MLTCLLFQKNKSQASIWWHVVDTHLTRSSFGIWRQQRLAKHRYSVPFLRNICLVRRRCTLDSEIQAWSDCIFLEQCHLCISSTPTYYYVNEVNFIVNCIPCKLSSFVFCIYSWFEPFFSIHANSISQAENFILYRVYNYCVEIPVKLVINITLLSSRKYKYFPSFFK